MATISSLLADHVTLQVRSVDRLLLSGYSAAAAVRGAAGQLHARPRGGQRRVARDPGRIGRGESIPYVAGWGEDGGLEAVTEFATTIDGLARRIEDVLAAEPTSACA